MMTSEKILIIDDDENNLYSFTQILKELELEMVTATSGEEGLKKLLEQDFSLILLDIQMPGMDGFETARLIKSRKKTKDIPIIFITAIYRSGQFVDQGFGEGAVDYLTKPIDPSLLKNKVSLFIQLFLQKREIEELNLNLEKKVEERTHSLRKLTNAIEFSAETIVITDTDGMIEYVNPAFEKVTGYSSDEIYGKKSNILRSGKHANEFYDQMWKTISSGNVWKGEMVNKKKDGTLFNEDMTISPVFSDEKKIVSYVAIKRDTTEEKILKEQLIHSEKLSTLGTFVSGVAHEINNPLSIILGFSEMMLQEDNLTKQLDEGLNTIVSQARRSSDIVKELLKFARKQKKSEKSVVDVAESLRTAIALQKYRLNLDGVNIQTFYPTEPATVIGEGAKLQQVFINIINNAQQALATSEKNKKVLNIIIKIVDSVLEVLIENNGPFIPRESIVRIFDPFYTTKKVNEGTGLGLSISYGIIQNHGGKIVASNKEKLEQSDDSGVSFSVTLPFSGKQTSLFTEDVEFLTNTPKNLKILVIDDEEPVLVWLQQFITSIGYEIVTAKNGIEALDHLQCGNFDLILSDIVMPEMNGYELGKWIYENKPDIAKRFVLITGMIDSQVEKFSSEYNYPYLVKPFIGKEILKLIATICVEGK